jgi:pimeloyl-ACP methyl ester carboxylesterase
MASSSTEAMMDMQRIETGGIVALERPGTGPALVLLHGIGSNAGSFAPLVPHLPAAWRLIAWNAPGYGGSAPLEKDWPVAGDYAAALLRFLDAMGVDRPLILGHSLGALMGAAFAAAHPDRVARLLLASPALGHGVTPGDTLSAAAQARIDDLEAQGPAAFAAARAPRLVFRPEDNPGIVARVETAMADVRQPGYGQAVRMLAAGRLTEDLARLTVPTDVVVGQEDLVTPPEGARSAHAALPEAVRGDLREIPEAGHALYQQAPAAVADALVTQTEAAR